MVEKFYLKVGNLPEIYQKSTQMGRKLAEFLPRHDYFLPSNVHTRGSIFT